ncbi:hypothetical protein PAXINDRAFT_14189 [Paxillus involutus ATCC 200175]|uniref:Uncharacterized protein n=1 Tax=Paxillus involutus ATCC 200175 TaxID=664439 RepID=A0A0C9SUV0_PAXIN|nr:hypothetical protein PAXINDRAFT_14189 [Paxillus involutus ATCC 200175]
MSHHDLARDFTVLKHIRCRMLGRPGNSAVSELEFVHKNPTGSLAAIIAPKLQSVMDCDLSSSALKNEKAHKSFIQAHRKNARGLNWICDDDFCIPVGTQKRATHTQFDGRSLAAIIAPKLQSVMDCDLSSSALKNEKAHKSFIQAHRKNARGLNWICDDDFCIPVGTQKRATHTQFDGRICVPD